MVAAEAHVWIDHERLTPGAPDWEAAIRRGIQGADALLYLASPYVQSKLLAAWRYLRRILPWGTQRRPLLASEKPRAVR